MLTEEMKDVVWTFDTRAGCFTYVSPSVERLRGFTAEEVMQAPMGAALTPASQARVEDVLTRELGRFETGATDSGEYTVLELEQPHKDGSTVWTEVVTHLVRNPDNGHIEVHGVTRDITERRRQQDHIRHMAQHDPLTGLANRALFASLLEQAIVESRRDGIRLALVYLDLDHFKPVNDLHGHAVGDRLLRAAAERMQASLRESDIVARIGGDEFVILLRGIADAAQAIQVADKARQALAEPFEIDGHVIDISGSLGIALYPEHGGDEITLSKKADDALYAAKRAGRNRVVMHGGADAG